MSVGFPPNAPYADVVVGEEIEVSATEEEGILTCECVYREDSFGAQVDLTGLTHLERISAIDELISGVCSIVWNELLGTPVFRDEDEGWVGRVDAQRPWEQMRRIPTRGWVDVDAVADGIAERSDALARETALREAVEAGSPATDLPDERDHVAASLGDANVADLKLSQDEMAALMRGEIPEDLIRRLLKARSTENLLDSAIGAMKEIESRVDGELPATGLVLSRALQELAEVRGRFTS